MRANLAALEGRVDAATHQLEIAQTAADRKKAADELAESRRLKAEAQQRLDAEAAAEAERIRKGGIHVNDCVGGSLDCLRGKH